MILIHKLNFGKCLDILVNKVYIREQFTKKTITIRMTVLIGEIVNKYLQSEKLNLREMAEALNVSHPTIINWRDGKTEPDTDLLIQLLVSFEDWRNDFAVEILQVRYPDLFVKEQVD